MRSNRDPLKDVNIALQIRYGVSAVVEIAKSAYNEGYRDGRDGLGAGLDVRPVRSGAESTLEEVARVAYGVGHEDAYRYIREPSRLASLMEPEPSCTCFVSPPCEFCVSQSSDEEKAADDLREKAYEAMPQMLLALRRIVATHCDADALRYARTLVEEYAEVTL